MAAVAFAMAVSFTSCEKKETTNPPVTNNDPLKNYTFLGEEVFHHDGLTAQLYMSKDPFVGYNRVAVRVFETSTKRIVESVNLRFRPMMDMGTMKHTTPVENPSYDATLKAHVGSASFIMPSGMAGSWTFELIGGPIGAVDDTAVFEIEVGTPAEARLYSFVSAADSVSSYFVALREPMAPKIGYNDFEIMIYKRENPMSFPPATDLKVEIEPEMPTMMHGSPNNENPIHIEDGLYRGKVNFTMTGYWKVHVDVKDANDLLMDDEGFFDITF